MTLATVSITQDDVFTVLGDFITAQIGVPVIQGVINRAAMPPVSPGFVAMTMLYGKRLATNITDYTDPVTSIGTRNDELHQQQTIQIDCYGPTSNEWSWILTTLLRSDVACATFPAGIQPLYADDPNMLPLVNGEEQYEQRWMLTCLLQVNPIVKTPMQFFDQAEVDIVNVNVTYPP